MRRRILVVEDDAALARVLRDNLVFIGFDVECVPNGRLALERVNEFGPDLIVLDVMLPDSDGFELCGLLRSGSQRPVIILSARSQKADKLRGLAIGAADYITKSFDLEEFLARIAAVLRRTRPTVDRLRLGQVMVDFLAFCATRGEQIIHLSHREFELLRYLAERQGHVVSRNELLNQLWMYADKPITRSVDHAIARCERRSSRIPISHASFTRSMETVTA